MFKPLIVYYSRSGTTRNVAQEILASTDWDSDEIIDPAPRDGLLGYLLSALDSVTRRLPPIEAPLLDPEHRPLIVVGTPIWNASVSSPVRSYLTQHAAKLSRVAFFATCGARGSTRAFRQMEEILGRPPVATLVLTERQIARGEHAALIMRFVEELRRFDGLHPPATVLEQPHVN